jgi:hypothetical protein
LGYTTPPMAVTMTLHLPLSSPLLVFRSIPRS